MKKMIIIALILVSPKNFAEIPDFIKSCADCHGDKGVSTEASVPTIAGMSTAFLEMSMYAYKDNVRPAVTSKYFAGDKSRPMTDMKKIADQMTEQQIAEMSAYFAAQTYVPAKQPFDASLVAAGEKVHDSKCKKCHEDAGMVADDDAGFLGGQWSPYLMDSMKFYLDGSREMEDKMKQKIDTMSDAEWKALVAFYASKQ